MTSNIWPRDNLIPLVCKYIRKKLGYQNETTIAEWCTIGKARQNLIEVCTSQLVLKCIIKALKRQQALLQVKVYFSSFEMETITESAHWTWTTIMMGLGGSLSLWLGITLAGMLEFAELFARLACALCEATVLYQTNKKSQKYP